MQVPAAFEYKKAESVGHALELLGRFGPESRVVAGGHSLIPMMKLRLAQPEALIDINGLVELGRIGVDGNHLVIGALVRHAELLDSPLVAEHFPIFQDAERVIADPIVRNRGTVGGSLCQADPSEDLSAAFAAVRAEAVILGSRGRRIVPIREFHAGPYETVVEQEELLVADTDQAGRGRRLPEGGAPGRRLAGGGGRGTTDPGQRRDQRGRNRADGRRRRTFLRPRGGESSGRQGAHPGRSRRGGPHRGRAGPVR